jgi:uncharacterized protein YcbK (DUF882 family)
MRWLALLVLLWPVTASAQTYIVQPGDSLGEIAEAHGITVDEVVKASGIGDPDHIEPGQELVLAKAEGEVVKRGVIHVVGKGVTLAQIAHEYGVSLPRLLRANKVRNPDLLSRGARILIPGAKRVIPIAARRPEPCLHAPVEIYKVHTDETRHVVLTQCNGKVWDAGRQEISSFLDRTPDKTAPMLASRLLVLIQRTVDRFPGRRIEVVSAFRPPVGERASSRHCKAKALDFRVSGIPNSKLRDFVRSFGDVGVGYYPNSTFVHLDVRDHPAFWVDWSGPGEPARYGTLTEEPIGDVSERRPRRDRTSGATPNPSISAAP